MRKILFVRHAQSMGNIGKVSSTPDEIPLSSFGIIQAKDLIKKIQETPDLIVLSKYLRTHQTAKPLIDSLPHIPVEKWNNVHEFTYLNQARCSNMSSIERRPIVNEYWDRNDPYYKDGGNAESFHEFINRIESSIYQIKNSTEYNIMIFSHGQFILMLKILMELKSTSKPIPDLDKLMHEFRVRSKTETPKNASIFDASEILKFKT